MTLFTPDAFLDDWYGWASNEGTHIFMGLTSAFSICVSYWFVMGEYPSRIAVLLVILVGYLAFVELWAQGWNGFDTIDDTIFFVGYGAGGALSPFREVAIGSPDVTVSLLACIPFFAMAIIHLLCGISWRLIIAKSKKDTHD